MEISTDEIMVLEQDDCQLMENGWTTNAASLVLAEDEEDAIPTIYNPKYTGWDLWSGRSSYDELAVGWRKGDQVLVFPHRILDKHEIAQVDTSAWISLCPLAGTTIGVVSSERLSVSGYVYNSNLMIKSSDESIFSQMLLTGMSGPEACSKLKSFPVMEASLTFWKNNFPEAQILSENTGYIKSYNDLPFNSLVQENATLFYTVDARSSRFPNYHYMHAVIFDEGSVKLYSSDLFVDGPKIILDFADAPIMIFGDGAFDWYTSFYLKDDQGLARDFDLVDENGRYFLKDNQSGSRWNIWGEAISGPAKGTKLVSTQNHNGFWYSFYALYKDQLEVYVEDEDE